MTFIQKQRTSIIHLVIWALLIHLIFDWRGLAESIIQLVRGEYFDEALIMIPFVLMLFYVNSEILIPKFLKGDTWIKYVISIVLFSAITLLTSMGLYQIILNGHWDTGLDDIIEFLDYSVVFYLIAIGISTALGFSNIAAKKEMQKREAIDKQKIAELKFLTTQVSPHFLFNSLNSIYALAQEEEADLTSEAILKLSHLMRYPFSDGMKERVSIQQEVDFIDNYIALQRSKLGDDYPIEYDVSIADPTLEIAPLLMIPIIENAFKYGVSRRESKPISIDISSTSDQLKLKVENPVTKNKAVISHQVGLDNLKERLNIIYPNKHTLNTSENEESFVAELLIEK